VPLGLVLFHRRLKPIARYQLENLAKGAAYSFHGEASLVCLRFVLAELNSRYQRLHLFLPANSDTYDPSLKFGKELLEQLPRTRRQDLHLTNARKGDPG